MKNRGIAVFIIFFLLLCVSCEENTGEDSRETGILTEASQADWTREVEKDCGIKGFGRPIGASEEKLKEKKQQWKITFRIDEQVTQKLIDDYARAVWEACEETNGSRLHNSAGYLYEDADEARRQQEPFDYYIWYYRNGKKEFRVGIFSTDMEDGVPGGIVLKLERWN